MKTMIEQERIRVPGGDFPMGSSVDQLREYYAGLHGWPPSCIDRERPQHTVNIDAFEIDKYPVTCGMYRRFCEATGHQRPSYWKGSDPPDTLVDHPVVYVSLMDAMAYCQWVGGRLPYETEWEKAARGTDGRTYPWGDEFDAAKANVDREGDARATTRVNAHPEGASPYGVMDMVGNVHEWTKDVVTPYPGYTEEKWTDADSSITATHIGLDGTTTNPAFLPNSSTVRGGSFGTVRGLCRCASRIELTGNAAMPDVGFRCVYAPDPDEIGKRLLERGDSQGALPHFEKALKLAPAHAGVLFNAAYCFQSAGQYKRAIELWQQLVDLWPNDQDAITLLRECRQHVGAIGSRTSAQTSEPSNKQGCFIATACYGPYGSPEVAALRRFRDDVLNKSGAGRLFVGLYYRLSPPVAAWLASHEIARSYVKSLIVKPLAWLAARTMKSRTRS
jgi:formylglycine-generating enzyme required for sulfatase activity